RGQGGHAQGRQGAHQRGESEMEGGGAGILGGRRRRRGGRSGGRGRRRGAGTRRGGDDRRRGAHRRQKADGEDARGRAGASQGGIERERDRGGLAQVRRLGHGPAPAR